MTVSIQVVVDDRYINAFYENVEIKSLKKNLFAHLKHTKCFIIMDFLAGNFLAHTVTFGDFMAGNFLARDFLARDFLAHHVTFRDFMAGNFLAGDFLGWILYTYMLPNRLKHRFTSIINSVIFSIFTQYRISSFSYQISVMYKNPL